MATIFRRFRRVKVVRICETWYSRPIFRYLHGRLKHLSKIWSGPLMGWTLKAATHRQTSWKIVANRVGNPGFQLVSH